LNTVRGLRVVGHPLHPALVHFPVALWTASLAADGALIATGATFWGAVAWWSLVAGLAMAALAAVAGFVDYSLLAPKHPGFRTATAHMLTMSLSALFFLAGAMLRGGPGAAAGSGALVCSGLGFLALLGGGWLGGTLVYHFGVAVEVVEGLDQPARDDSQLHSSKT
jgi:uncharacterized membrane protein